MSPGLKMDPPGLHHLEEPITHKNDKSTGGGSVKGTKSSDLVLFLPLPRLRLGTEGPRRRSPSARRPRRSARDDAASERFPTAEIRVRRKYDTGDAHTGTRDVIHRAGKGFPCFYDQKPSFCSNGACSFHGFPSQFSRLIVNWILPAESAALLLPRRCRGCLPAGRRPWRRLVAWFVALWSRRANPTTRPLLLPEGRSEDNIARPFKMAAEDRRP